MFILKTKSQLEKAIEKAKVHRPKVRFLAFGSYLVSNSKGLEYNVRMKKTESGEKQIFCECKGGNSGYVCYHAVSALSLHIGLARQKQTAV